MCRDHVASGNFYPRALNSTGFAISRVERPRLEESPRSLVPSLFTWFISPPGCASRYRSGENTPVDGGKYINTRVELGSKGKSKLEKYPSSGGLLFSTRNKRGKERKNDDFRTKRGRCVLARGKNFSSSLARPGEGERESGEK